MARSRPTPRHTAHRPRHCLRSPTRYGKTPPCLAAAVAVAIGFVTTLWIMSLRVSRERLTQVLRLADVKRVADCTAEAEDLWPCVPEKVPDMERWLASTRELYGRLAGHRATLAALRATALPPSREREIARLEADLASARTWTFEDQEATWQHGVVAELVAGLERLGQSEDGLIADVERRLAFARTVKTCTIDDAKPKWDEAIASIGNRDECPTYGGLVIEPQLGLIPIGRDPRSGLWEFAHLQTGEMAGRDQDGRVIVTEETGVVFVLLPGGTFRMGAARPDERNPEGTPNVDSFAQGDEGPAHAVTLSPFLVSKYETTQGQWLRSMRRKPSSFGAGATAGGREIDLRNPVENVCWDDCRACAERLGLCLPTEAQWEYAARAGGTSVWPTGNEKKTLQGAANLCDKYCKGHGGSPMSTYEEDLDDGHTVHAPVGTYAPNAFGLHDTAGNVAEWCHDWFDYYSPVSAKDPVGPERGSARINRGGSWYYDAAYCRSAYRAWDEPGSRSAYLGLRLVKAVLSAR